MYVEIVKECAGSHLKQALCWKTSAHSFISGWLAPKCRPSRAIATPAKVQSMEIETRLQSCIVVIIDFGLLPTGSIAKDQPRRAASDRKAEIALLLLSAFRLFWCFASAYISTRRRSRRGFHDATTALRQALSDMGTSSHHQERAQIRQTARMVPAARILRRLGISATDRVR
jgi:hypothetical protein